LFALDASVTFEENLHRWILDHPEHPLYHAFEYACKVYEEDDALITIADELRLGLASGKDFQEVTGEKTITECEKVLRQIAIHRLKGRK